MPNKSLGLPLCLSLVLPELMKRRKWTEFLDTLGYCLWIYLFSCILLGSIHGLMDVATWIMQCHWRVMPNKSLNCPLEEKKRFSHLDWAYVNTLISFGVDLTSSFWWLSNFWWHFRLWNTLQRRRTLLHFQLSVARLLIWFEGLKDHTNRNILGA